MNGQLHRLDTLRKVALAPVIILGLLSILATGGGGGGGGGGTTGGVTYVGNTNPAVITTTNASKLTANVIGGAPSPVFTSPTKAGSNAARVSNVDASGVGAAQLAQRLNRVIRKTLAGTQPALSTQQAAPTAIQVDQLEACDTGSTRIFGTLSDNGTGTLTITFNDCRFGDETLSGSATIMIIAVDPGLFQLGFIFPTDFTVSFPLLTFSNSILDISISMSGSLHSQIAIVTDTESITVNIVDRDNNTGEMIKVENLVMVNVYDYILYPSSYSQTVSNGRVYDSIEGYVDVSTIQPLVFGTLTQSFPDSGQVLLTGAANARIRATALSAVLVRVELDLDGDMTYETVAILKVTDLASDAGANLADSDGDGMHDSWETLYGLNPSDPADAAFDRDGDGFSNFEEYQAGTDPSDPLSAPPSADLAITNTDAPDPVIVGENLVYTINVTNMGPADAVDVVVADTLPSALAFVSVTTSQGSCIGATTITCNLGSMSPGHGATIHLTVSPSVEGLHDNTASVSSGTLDPNSSNNSATANTTVGPASADLAITNTDAPDPVGAGTSLVYTITVTNAGPSDAVDVVVTDTLPSALAFVSVTTSQGSCIGAMTITCNLGSVSWGSVATISLTVSPSVEGLHDNTASVSSGTLDPNPSNNSATATTTVGTSVSGLQAMIDAANAGDTIVVPPGLYVGGLDFNGKDITLASSDGPESTIIHGNSGTGVRMGPGGTITGFTITGAEAYFGAGIAVSGTGSLIAGNVFDGNLQYVGGYGAAIGGNSASPTIAQNVFRNNSCQNDNQHIAGIVAFINSSSPLIVNNILENNPCRAINLTLPEGNTPVVINNTIVGNRTGIRVSRQVSQVTETYRNNIIVQNDIGLDLANGTDANNPVWENNLVFGNVVDYQGTTDKTGTAGNISADPLFVDLAGGDYHLQAGSPAIDAGSALDAPTVDFDGTPRPLDGDGDATAITDIGAFEAPQP